MTHCERLSDRMPDVAHGRSGWSPEEENHLTTCADCRSEWELVRTASHLGDSLPPLRSPETVAATLLGRLAVERARLRARQRNWLVAGLAAAAVTIIAVRIPRPEGVVPLVSAPAPAPAPVPVSGPQGAARQLVPLPELDDLPSAELEAILGSLDEPGAASAASEGAALEDFDDHELEQVLGAWEG
jgi:hypothetical protein